MKLDFRQRLLATTLLVGAGMVASPAFAQDAPPANPADTANGSQPETTTPVDAVSTLFTLGLWWPRTITYECRGEVTG